MRSFNNETVNELIPACSNQVNITVKLNELYKPVNPCRPIVSMIGEGIKDWTLKGLKRLKIKKMGLREEEKNE